MLETIRDDKDRVVAYCEWNLCDKKGRFDSEGKYVFVRDIWIHKSLRGKKHLQGFIIDIAKKAPTAKYAYWERKKYNNKIKMFTREQLLKM